jgi:hypothetical protein
MKKLWLVFVYAFAIFGFVMLAGFLAVRFEFSNVKGEADENSSSYNDFALQKQTATETPVTNENSTSTTDLDLIGELDSQISLLEDIKSKEKENLCKIFVVSRYADYNAKNIFEVYKKYSSQALLDQMIFAIQLKQDLPNFNEQVKVCADMEIDFESLEQKFSNIQNSNLFVWQDSEHWRIIKEGIARDKDKIQQAASIAGVDERQIVAIAIVEQLRLYYTQRELFEKIFKPLKILASANKMAWGIMAIKEKTAMQIESNLQDEKSPYYLGKDLETALNFTSANHNNERYKRLTNEKDHFYSYLYGALYIKQIETQWQKQGFDISDRPEILATIFNIGFKNSVPKANPMVGGSTMNILGQTYSFGGLAHEFYYSGEMEDVFPFEK